MYVNIHRHAIFTIGFLLCILQGSYLDAQSVRISSGLGQSTFFDFKKNSAHSYATYASGGHQYLKFELNTLTAELNEISFHIQLDRSSSFVESQNLPFIFCGMGAPPVTTTFFNNSNVEMYRMSLGVMPVNIKLFKNVRLKMGAEVSKIFKYSLSNTDSEVTRPIAPRPLIGTNDVREVNRFSAGALFELELGRFNLGNNLMLLPVYNSSVGITEEINTGFYSRSFRHSLGIALQWGLRPNAL